MADPAPARSRTAVVLGSSFLGVYAHAGFLEGLTEGGFEPARIAGSSAGALAGAFFACGLRGPELRKVALDPKLRLSFADAGALWRIPGVATSFWASGIFSGKRTVAHLRGLFAGRDLAGLPLDVVVTDIDRHDPVVLREGPLAEIVMASCAVPGLFTVQTVDGKRYLDGGIGNELPFEHFILDPEIDTIVIHRIRHEPGTAPLVRWLTVGTAIGAAHSTTCRELHRLRSDLARTHGKRLVEIDTLTPFPGMLSNRRAPLCHQRGIDSGKRAADRLSSL